MYFADTSGMGKQLAQRYARGAWIWFARSRRNIPIR